MSWLGGWLQWMSPFSSNSKGNANNNNNSSGSSSSEEEVFVYMPNVEKASEEIMNELLSQSTSNSSCVIPLSVLSQHPLFNNRQTNNNSNKIKSYYYSLESALLPAVYSPLYDSLYSSANPLITLQDELFLSSTPVLNNNNNNNNNKQNNKQNNNKNSQMQYSYYSQLHSDRCAALLVSQMQKTKRAVLLKDSTNPNMNVCSIEIYLYIIVFISIGNVLFFYIR